MMNDIKKDDFNKEYQRFLEEEWFDNPGKHTMSEFCALIASHFVEWQKQKMMKDLPHWKKSTLPNDNVTGFNSDYFSHNGYYINYKELFDKLPKENYV